MSSESREDYFPWHQTEDVIEDGLEEDISEIEQFYAASTVLLTGGTGFLGKLLAEKLLRTCEIKKMYLIVRPKKDKEPKKRLEEIFSVPCFGPLKQKDPSFMERVSILNGDCAEPDLGLNEQDITKITSEVDVIFHCAATTKFSDTLKRAANINVRATMDLLKMAKKIKQLKAFIYVSTAFSNSFRSTIEEKVYECRITGEHLLQLCDAVDEDFLNDVTPNLLREHPNTYTFTKAIAEEVVKNEANNLPVTIVRPAIVIGTHEEPLGGWIDSFYGATGMLIGGCLGVIRSVHGIPTKKAELVPADYVINVTIAAGWDVACKKKKQNVSEEHLNSVTVFNYVSSPEKPITWNDFMSLGEKHAMPVPSPLVVWYPIIKMRSNKFLHFLAAFFLQTIPAHIVDVGLRVFGKQPMLVKGYEKIDKYSSVIAYFSTREWNFDNSNTQKLWKKLTPLDQKRFNFNMAALDWDMYFYTYIRGCRVYLLNDPMDTIPRGAIKYKKLMVAHYSLIAILMYSFFKLICSIFM